jgi:hypothetical protein
MTAEFLGRRGDENFNILAWLKPGVTLQYAQVALFGGVAGILVAQISLVIVRLDQSRKYTEVG